MHLIFSLVIGLLVGLVARFIMPGPNPHGLIVTSLLGIAGAFIATFLGQAMNIYPPDHPAGFIASVLGAMIALFVYHLVFRKSSEVR